MNLFKDLFNSPYLHYILTGGALLMASLALIIRMKASHRPVTVKSIMIPPLGMTTGFWMFIIPEMRIPILWAVIAFAAGWLLFSYPLIRSTRFEMTSGQVFAKRSPSFMYILIGLMLLRLILHGVVEQYISVPQTGSVFFILAYGMILRWRLHMLKQYRQVTSLT